MDDHYLCEILALQDTGAHDLSLPRDGGSLEIVLVRRGEKILGYENRCPHTGVPLNWLPDRFLDETGRNIVCATHAANFRVEDGACLFGPCDGQGLKPLPIEIRAGRIYLKAGV